MFVSKYGHLVTALHCLTDIFEQVDDESLLTAHPVKSGLIFKSNTKFEGHSVRISPIIVGQKFDVNTEFAVKVILLGKGYPQRTPDISSNNEVFEVYRSLMEDFAIVKFDHLPSTAGC